MSLNPSFAIGRPDRRAGRRGLLHPECDRIFRVKTGPDDLGTAPLTLHLHQREAIEVAARRESYVLTTGTGSGKSLAYIVPIVDRVLRAGTGRGRPGDRRLPDERPGELPDGGAAASSSSSGTAAARRSRSPGTPGRRSPNERQEILANPPDILLTNYVMLELVLTRPDERSSLVKAAKGLQFLVLDELHTYRGRQGADVAMLVRRVREACEAQDSLRVRRHVGDDVLGRHGGPAAPGCGRRRDAHLRRTGRARATSSPRRWFAPPATGARATSRLPTRSRARGDAEADRPGPTRRVRALTDDPLASWIEDTFGVTEEQESGRLIRRPPTTVDRAADWT